ncbi:MAG: amino acid adenylation domain-containing protein [bacterium]|nr:amino acid adenylation domain-containing protein [bacterium]
MTDNEGALRLCRYSMIYLTEYDLSVVISTFHHLKVTMTYDAGWFSDEAVAGIGRHFTMIIKEIISDSHKTINRLELLSETEKRELLIDFNDSGAVYTEGMTVNQLFAGQVEKHPDHAAVICDNEHLTYKRLNDKINRLAGYLRLKGAINPDTVIGIMMDNSMELVVSILGTLKAGATYLPISPDYPQARKNYIIRDSGTELLLLSKNTADNKEAVAQGFPGLLIIAVDDINMSQAAPAKLEDNKHPENLAYILYTSGTTGKPKGVAVHHRGLCNYLCWAKKNYVKDENVNFPLYTSISFDLTVTSLFTPLISGNGVVVYKDENKELLVEKIIDECRVQVIKLTPAHLKILRERMNGEIKATTGIRRFIVGGEELETQLAKDIHTMFAGKVEIYNEYGPTETVVGCMIHRFDPEEDNRLAVPIGIPADNMQIYILDAAGKPVPKEVIGEISISGRGVARGYLNNPDLTFEKFIDGKPYSPHSPIYRSGDLARWLPDGSIEFLGRKDHQVKIRGFRIELGEIENKLKNYGKKPVTRDFHHHKTRCARCLLPGNYPGISFDDEGVCSFCREFDSYKEHADNYFKTREDFRRLIEKLKGKTKTDGKGKYDCLLLYSGGKDSSYVLYKLVDMGLKVLTFTFDNGYISKAAFRNIEHTTSQLNVDHLTGKLDNMKSIFRESLKTHHEVCTGCWRALNTIGGKVAYEKGIPTVVTGLSRGQIFDMKLHGLFSVGTFDEDKIEEQLLMLRKMYHSREEKLSTLMDTQLTDEVIEETEFVDFFRYDDVSIKGIMEYLEAKNWSVPGDTGFCSTNCIVNDAGIYVHLQEKGYHNYAAPLSWDLRYGLMSREKALKEIDFEGDLPKINGILEEIGYIPEIPGADPIKDAVVIDKKDENGGNGNKYLSAYIVSGGDVKVSQLREYLAGELPEYMIPSYFTLVDKIPLTANGKVNRRALPAGEGIRPRLQVDYVMPATELEEKVVSICRRVLAMDKIGIYDNFFDLGANSYHIIQINNRLKTMLEIDVPIVKLFTHPTVRKLADYLSTGKAKKESIPRQRDRSGTIAKGRDKLKARKKAIKLDRMANG